MVLYPMRRVYPQASVRHWNPPACSFCLLWRKHLAVLSAKERVISPKGGRRSGPVGLIANTYIASRSILQNMRPHCSIALPAHLARSQGSGDQALVAMAAHGNLLAHFSSEPQFPARRGPSHLRQARALACCCSSRSSQSCWFFSWGPVRVYFMLAFCTGPIYPRSILCRVWPVCLLC